MRDGPYAVRLALTATNGRSLFAQTVVLTQCNQRVRVPFAGPLGILPIVRLSERVRTRAQNLQTQNGDVTNCLYDGVNGMRMVKAFRPQGYQRGRAAEVFERIAGLQLRGAKVRAGVDPLLEAMGDLVVAGALTVRGWRVARGEGSVGAGGNRLSGGQRQRVALACAILKDAPIRLLEKATSALDLESEQRVQATLARLAVGRTSLVIAQRLATWRDAARIVVFDEGRVVEIGTHDELLAKNGVYSRLTRIRFRDALAAGASSKAGSPPSAALRAQ